MARIKIKDLPKDMKISREDMKRIMGGDTILRSYLSNPLVIAGLTATAIAIPVAIHNSSDKAPSS